MRGVSLIDLVCIQLLRNQKSDPEFWLSLMCDLGVMHNTLARHLLDRPPLSKLTSSEVCPLLRDKRDVYGVHIEKRRGGGGCIDRGNITDFL